MRLGPLAATLLLLAVWAPSASSQVLLVADGPAVKRVSQTGVEVLVGGLSNPSDVEVSGERVYWVDFGTRKIQRMLLDGTGVQDLVSGLNNARL